MEAQMNKRLYFLVPDLATCQTMVNELKGLGIKQSHIHIIGKQAIPLRGFHKASVLETTEFKHGIEEGLGVGGVAGLLGGLIAVTFPPAGLVLGGAALLATTLAGAGLGALVSGLIAKDIPNRKLMSFQDAIASGQLLLLVDVAKTQVDAVMELVRTHHPEAEIGTTTPPTKAQLADSGAHPVSPTDRHNRQRDSA